MEFRRLNVYTVNNMKTKQNHILRITYISGGSIEVRVVASTKYTEGNTLELRFNDKTWFEDCNWMLKKGFNPAYEAVVELTKHHVEFLTDLALATKDFEWLKQLQTMEVAK